MILNTLDCLYKHLCFLQANVVCKQLKYGASGNSYEPDRNVDSNFSYDDVKCTGSETSLDACPHANQHNCRPNEGIWIVCASTEGGEFALLLPMLVPIEG